MYAVRAEMATTLDDVLLRRTRAHLFDRAATVDRRPGRRRAARPASWAGTPTRPPRQVAAYGALVEHEQAEARERAVPGEARVAEAVPGS